mmetsp:Transcript_29700/g.83728  ORF Transcript_29700/g.83728 Transcript_29700/m.83728 type:complete len:238 (-) Transcript_29700:460-1173(-)
MPEEEGSGCQKLLGVVLAKRTPCGTGVMKQWSPDVATAGAALAVATRGTGAPRVASRGDIPAAAAAFPALPDRPAFSLDRRLAAPEGEVDGAASPRNDAHMLMGTCLTPCPGPGRLPLSQLASPCAEGLCWIASGGCRAASRSFSMPSRASEIGGLAAVPSPSRRAQMRSETLRSTQASMRLSPTMEAYPSAASSSATLSLTSAYFASSAAAASSALPLQSSSPSSLSMPAWFSAIA